MKAKKTRNKFETVIHKQLKKKKKVSLSYETAKIPYTIHGNYIPDFVLTGKDRTIYIETKGHFRPEAKRKMVAVKKQHPHLDIRIIFYSKKLKDIRWAERYGFPYAIGDVPQEWMEELL
jgi:predicted nuclease of restriction endonuclease-like RecB superfamily